MTFNEFNRELTRRIQDPQVAYMLTILFEQQRAIVKQQEELGQMLVHIAGQISGFVSLHEATQKKVTALAAGRFHEGVDVRSETVADDPEKKH